MDSSSCRLRSRQLEDVDDALRHHLQHRGPLGRQLVGLGVEHAEAADGRPLRRHQRCRGVEPDGVDLAGDERVVGEAGIRAGVGGDHRRGLVEHDRAHGVLA